MVWTKQQKAAHSKRMKVMWAKKQLNHMDTIGETQPDPINRPLHYTSHPSGIECIQITEHMGFNLGNAMKYIWRADLKNDAIEDLGKAMWYIQREITKRMKEKLNADTYEDKATT